MNICLHQDSISSRPRNHFMTSTNDQLGTILQTQGRNFFLVRNADDRISNPEVNQHKVANLRSIVRVYFGEGGGGYNTHMPQLIKEMTCGQ